MVHGVDNVGTVPAALTAYLALQVRVQLPVLPVLPGCGINSSVCPSALSLLQVTSPKAVLFGSL